MTIPTRVRVLTPEALDAAAANLVNTPGSSLATAVANKAGTGTPTTTGVVTATANSLMQRDANGRSQIATPSVAAEIANKGYVDTAISGVVPTSSKGVASGVASLDSSGYVPSGQIAPLFPRNLGSGMSFPASKNLGDIYNHTGIGCAFRWGGTQWEQMGRCVVTSRTARNALLNNYNSVLPLGFRVTQTNFNWIWIKDAAGWAYGGWEGAADTYSTVNTGPSFKYNAANLQVAHNQSASTVSAWTFQPGVTGQTEREIITYSGGVFTINDRCALSIHAVFLSDIAGFGSSLVEFDVPGGGVAIGGGTLTDQRHRGSTPQGGYPGNGTLFQPIHWTGFADPTDTFQFKIFQYNSLATNVVYQCNVQISVRPAL